MVALISSKTRNPTSAARSTSGGGAGASGTGSVRTFWRLPSTSNVRKNSSASGPFSSADHRADRRQRLAERAVERVRDRGVERAVGLADLRFAAIHADAHAGERNAARARRGIEADEGRLVEQVAVAVELAHLEQDVGLRHVDEVAHREQQEELLADAGLEVLLDLRRRQRAVVDRDQAEHALDTADRRRPRCRARRRRCRPSSAIVPPADGSASPVNSPLT